MVCETFTRRTSLIHRLDPRARVVTASALSVVLAVSSNFPVLLIGLALGLFLALLARLPAGATLKRFAAVNGFVGFVAVFLPFTAGGRPLFHVGPLTFGLEGLAQAGIIGLKANAIVLTFTALLSTVELPRLGRALRSLGAPRKLAQIFFFTVRYVDVLHHEYRRLRNAMKVRCFRPGLSLHTYRTFGYLVGMLLVNSLDRSERVLSAMRCRGFRGDFRVLRRFSFERRDALFSCVSAIIIGLLVGIQLL